MGFWNNRWHLAPAALLVTAAFNLSGCASLSKEECLTANWDAIGYSDGFYGFAEHRLADHYKACGEYKITPNDTAWRAGYRRGIASYCRPTNGYELGKSGRSYDGQVCPANLEPAYRAGFQDGAEIHDIDERIDSADDEVRKLTDKIEAKQAESADAEALIVSPRSGADNRGSALATIKASSASIAEMESDIAARQAELHRLHTQRDAKVRAMDQRYR